MACQPVSLLAWLRDHEPEVIENTKYVFSINDYIRYCLTGTANGEYTNFSGANLVNLHTAAYDKELLALFGLESVWDKLPPLKYSVAAGMFDVNACGIASGLSDEEQMCMIAGTWSINEFIRKKPVLNGSVALNSMFCIPEYYLIEESSPTSAGNMQWFIDEILAEKKEELKAAGKSIYDYTNQIISEIDPASSNVIFLPFLNGSNEDPLAKACFVGLTDYHNRGHMLRAVYEGIVFSHMVHVERLFRNREKPEAIRLAGGAANSEEWVQIFADVLGIPVETVACDEQGIMGAAMAAGIGAGVFETYEQAVRSLVHVSRRVEPRREYQAVYEKKYKLYKKVIAALGGVWEDLSVSE